jgi:hypothetical protein
MGGIWEIASCASAGLTLSVRRGQSWTGGPGCPAGMARNGASRSPGIGTRESGSMAARSRREPFPSALESRHQLHSNQLPYTPLSWT